MLIVEVCIHLLEKSFQNLSEKSLFCKIVPYQSLFSIKLVTVMVDFMKKGPELLTLHFNEGGLQFSGGGGY